MQSKRIDSSTRDKRRAAASLVFELLPEDGSEMSWGDLEKKALSLHMSTATLSFHLKRYDREGLVRRRVDKSSYPPRTYYSVAVKPSPSPIEFLSELRLRETQEWLYASVKEDTVVEHFYFILRAHMFELVQSAADILFKSLGISGGNGWQTLYDIIESKRKALLTGEKAHERADELMDVWFRPRVHEIIDLCHTRDPKTREPLMEEVREAWMLYPLVQNLLTDSRIPSLEKELDRQAQDVGLRVPGVEGFKSPVLQLLTMPLAKLGTMEREDFLSRAAEISRKYGVDRKLVEYLRKRKTEGNVVSEKQDSGHHKSHLAQTRSKHRR